ncbi:CBS domain-containing protein [Candidatus Undinarchaeota archaeon]
MKLSEIMKKDVTTIDKDQTVHDALMKMSKSPVSKLPVINNGKLVGIVTYADIISVLGSSKQQALPTHIHLSNAMQSDVKIASEDHDTVHAANIMLNYEISSLPILRGDDLVGIITTSDLVGTITDETKNVGAVMSAPITIGASDRIVRAREIMSENKVSMLPVVDGGELVGVLTHVHLAEALGTFREKNEKHQATKVTHILAEDTMSRDITSVSSNTTIPEALQTMDSKKVTSLPVLENGKLVGVVSKTNMLSLLR